VERARHTSFAETILHLLFLVEAPLVSSHQSELSEWYPPLVRRQAACFGEFSDPRARKSARVSGRMRCVSLFSPSVLFLEFCCFGQIHPNTANEKPTSLAPVFSLVEDAPASPIRLGGALTINVTVTNVSAKEIYWVFDRGKNTTYKVFSVLLMKDGKEVETTFFHRKLTGRQRPDDSVEVENGSTMPFGPYPPGKMFVITIELKRLYEITEPGDYTVCVSRFDEYSKTTVPSNSVTLKIVP